MLVSKGSSSTAPSAITVVLIPVSTSKEIVFTRRPCGCRFKGSATAGAGVAAGIPAGREGASAREADRKSTRLNSSHANISYAVFCLKQRTEQHYSGGAHTDLA